MSADDLISVEEFVEAMLRAEALRDRVPDGVDLTNDELVDEVVRLGIVSGPTVRAINLIVRAFGVVERPSIRDCVAAAEARGARPECVAAAWGYLPTASVKIGSAPWLDVEVETDDYAIIRWDDSELAACLFLYRVRNGGGRGPLGCRVSRAYRRR